MTDLMPEPVVDLDVLADDHIDPLAGVGPGVLDAVNRDLQLLHFRRAPLALTAEQAALTPDNPHRLALRKLEPLQRLRSMTTARLIHNNAWPESLRRSLTVV